MHGGLHDSPQEFWRPPAIHPRTDSATLAATCRCGSEFILSARFCHVCGAARMPGGAAHPQALKQVLEPLQFHSVQRWFGLSTGALAAFLIGIGCVLGAIAVGPIYAAERTWDFEAVHLWRIEWLLGAVAAFVAGILLKRVELNKK